MPPGTLTVHVMGATGLAAGDKDGLSDPYAKLKVKTGQHTYYKETEVVKKTLDPTWRKGPWTFHDVASDATELVLVVKDKDFGPLSKSDYLGQLKITLRDLVTEVPLPPDGTPVEVRGPRTLLRTVTEGSRKSKLGEITPTGEVQMKIGWRQMSEEERQAMVERNGARRSSELATVTPPHGVTSCQPAQQAAGMNG